MATLVYSAAQRSWSAARGFMRVGCTKVLGDGAETLSSAERCDSFPYSHSDKGYGKRREPWP
jgi:hypothetical protein